MRPRIEPRQHTARRPEPQPGGAVSAAGGMATRRSVSPKPTLHRRVPPEIDTIEAGVESLRRVDASGPKRTTSRRAGFDAGLIARWIRAAADEISSHRDHLTQLDAAIGDADHGVNMDRGFTAAMSGLDAIGSLPPGEILTQTGATLIFRVGGAAGPLYGSAFRAAGDRLVDARFDAEELLGALRDGLEAMQALGAAVEGDKTIVDAWAPAMVALERELRAGAGPDTALHAARVAAETGASSTAPMQAKKGRASYLGPRSVGHQDPGATSTALLFRALEHAVKGPE
jgi:dihydroxyacetone kinase-like protein